MKTIAFFNNKGGVGKTSLVYHVAHMMAEHNLPVLAVDLDPQSNLTSMFLPEERLEELWPDEAEHSETVFGALRPILRGIGDINPPEPVKFSHNLGLIPGDLGLSSFEDKLSDAWPRCHNSDEAAFRTMTAFHRLIEAVAGDWAELVLIDLGPNLGAINRAALIASDYICLPLAPDLFSLQGLRNLGPTVRGWSAIWSDLREKAPRNLSLPTGSMQPVGYVIMQHGIRDSRLVGAYQRWMDRIPFVYREMVLNETAVSTQISVQTDPHKLALLKHYRSLMPLAMESRKPMFHLKPFDGAIGAHVKAVQDCYTDFHNLSKQIAATVGLTLE